MTPPEGFLVPSSGLDDAISFSDSSMTFCLASVASRAFAIAALALSFPVPATVEETGVELVVGCDNLFSLTLSLLADDSYKIDFKIRIN